VYVDLLDIKSAMLDSAIDEVEKEAEQASSGPLLNLPQADAGTCAATRSCHRAN